VPLENDAIMPAFKLPDFNERAAASRQAKERALQALREKPALDPAVVEQRKAAEAAKKAAEIARREAKRAAVEAEKRAKEEAIEAEKRAKEEARLAAIAAEEAARAAAEEARRKALPRGLPTAALMRAAKDAARRGK